jgi:uncharacterized protein YqeY
MLKELITENWKQAFKDKDDVKKSTLSMLRAAITNAEKEKQTDLSEDEVIRIIQKEVKKRQEAATGFRDGGREDSALKEEAEAVILNGYLPEQISDEELDNIIDEAVIAVAASTQKDMGRVMKELMPILSGKADNKKVSEKVKSKLT